MKMQYAGVTIIGNSNMIVQKITVSEDFLLEKSLYLSYADETIKLNAATNPNEVMLFFEKANCPYEYKSSYKMDYSEKSKTEYEYIYVNKIPLEMTFRLGYLSRIRADFFMSSDVLGIGTSPEKMFSSRMGIEDIKTIFGDNYSIGEYYKQIWK